MLARLVTAALSLFYGAEHRRHLLALDREGQRAAGVPATTWEQRFFDEHFPDSYLQSRMQNAKACTGRDRLRPAASGAFSNARTSSPPSCGPMLRRRGRQGFLQVGGARLSAEAQALPVTGCWNDSWNGLQELAVEGRGRPQAHQRAPTIPRVAHKRVLRVLQMHAYLMGAPCEQLLVDERVAVVAPRCAPKRSSTKRRDGLANRRRVADGHGVRSFSARAMGASIIPVSWSDHAVHVSAR